MPTFLYFVYIGSFSFGFFFGSFILSVHRICDITFFVQRFFFAYIRFIIIIIVYVIECLLCTLNEIIFQYSWHGNERIEKSCNQFTRIHQMILHKKRIHSFSWRKFSFTCLVAIRLEKRYERFSFMKRRKITKRFSRTHKVNFWARIWLTTGFG